MAIAHFLLQSNFNSIHLRPTKWSSCANNNIPLKRNYSPYYCIKTSPKHNIKCFIINPKPKKGNNLIKVAGTNGNVIKPVITGVLLGLILLCDHHQAPIALAASSEIYRTQTSSPARMAELAANVVESSPYELPLLVSVLLLWCYFIIKWVDDWLHSELTSVLKLQVGLLGTNTSLQRDLKRIVGTDKHMSYVLQEATLALIRHHDYVTILVAASKELKVPPVTSTEQLKKALQSLASIPSNYINNVEVLWDPQHENDSLTEQELLEDYPLLHPI